MLTRYIGNCIVKTNYSGLEDVCVNCFGKTKDSFQLLTLKGYN